MTCKRFAFALRQDSMRLASVFYRGLFSDLPQKKLCKVVAISFPRFSVCDPSQVLHRRTETDAVPIHKGA
jgi:hypothetical protein